MKALVLAGDRCEKVMARLIVKVPVKDVQADEIWSFIQKKEKQCGPDDDPNFGDAYCFVAIERHSKLVLNFALGKRDQATTDIFIEGLRHATASQNFQITTDGFKPYVSAIENTLSDRVDFAQLIKVYRASVAGEARYSPAEVVFHGGGPSHRRSHSEAHLHLARRASESHHANADSAFHPLDQRLQPQV